MIKTRARNTINLKASFSFFITFCGLLFFFTCSGGNGGGSENITGPSTTLILTLPVNSNEVFFTETGIWPFGAKGGDHPEGHPGIDFDVARGTPIRAAAQGIVGSISDSVYPGSQSITVNHVSYNTFYTGFFVEIFINTGQSVDQGLSLASADFFLDSGVASVHFELNSSGAICPEPFFISSAVSDLNNLLKSSNYSDKDKYPNICN